MCKTLSFVVDQKSNIYFFDKQQRLELCQNNPKDYSPDSHASICDFFFLNEDKCDKFELRLKTLKIQMDQANTKRSEENMVFLQNFVSRQTINFWSDLILSSHRIIINEDCPEWLTIDGKLSLPLATSVDCRNNQLTSLELPLATSVNCENNQLTSLELPLATYVYCKNNQLTLKSIKTNKNCCKWL